MPIASVDTSRKLTHRARNMGLHPVADAEILKGKTMYLSRRRLLQMHGMIYTRIVREKTTYWKSYEANRRKGRPSLSPFNPPLISPKSVVCRQKNFDDHISHLNLTHLIEMCQLVRLLFADTSAFCPAASNGRFPVRRGHTDFSASVHSGPKSKPLQNEYDIVLMPANNITLDLFVKLKYQSSIIILSFVIKYVMCDLECDLNNVAWPTKWRHASHTLNDVSSSSGNHLALAGCDFHS